MRRLAKSVLCLAVALAACGDDSTGPTFPRVEGSYAGTWTFTLTHVASGANDAFTCPGSVSISDQNDGSFTGSFIIRAAGDCADSNPTSGSISGQVRQDGGLNFTLQVPGSSLNFMTDYFGCVFVSGSSQLNGTFASGRIQAAAASVYDCPVNGSWERYELALQVDAT